MNNPKADAALNLSLSLPESLHEKSTSLSAVLTGSVWEILVLASQDLSFLTKQYPQIEVSMLLENFALLRLPPSLIPTVSALPQILYIEMPHYISFEILSGKRSSCITQVTLPPLSLTGNGVLVGFVDSGIDLTHPDFQDSNGNSRVLFLWDQTRDEDPPDGYLFGTEYNNEQIVVKMRKNKGLYPRTTELISGIDYCIRKALKFNRPLVLNISFGNNYGSHTGNSLSELYLNRVSLLGRISIIAASGNEGASPIHTLGFLDQTVNVDFTISERQTSLNMQLWKDYADAVRIRLRAPSGTEYTLSDKFGTNIEVLDQTQIAFYNSAPSPFQRLQEYYFEFFPIADSFYLTSGVWSLIIEPISIKNGTFEMWLPAASSLNGATRFLSPDPYNTLTVPSSANSVITVGAYDAKTNTPADFSGRGAASMPNLLTKPDLVAPGVSVIVPSFPGGYQTVSGTSFAAPFVTGSAALLMEWGIVKRNNLFLYGEQLKAWLIAGAKELPGYPVPNPRTGWGALCLEAALR